MPSFTQESCCLHSHKRVVAFLASTSESGNSRNQLTRPGHLSPLVAEYGDLKLRQGHTEGSLLLSQLAGTGDVAAIVELVRNDGTMMRLAECKQLVRDNPAIGHLVTIEQLQEYVRLRPRRGLHIAAAEIALEGYGQWQIFCYESGDSYAPHVALIHGDIWDSKDAPLLARIHSECFTGDVLGSQQCDCGPQLEGALERISQAGRGLIIFPAKHEGRATGLVAKISAYRAQQLHAVNTFAASRLLGLPEDNRSYAAAAHILRHLGVSDITLLTENPAKTEALSEFLSSSQPLICPSNKHNAAYLQAKAERYRNIEEDDKQIMSKIGEFNQTPVTVTSAMRKLSVGIVTT